VDTQTEVVQRLALIHDVRRREDERSEVECAISLYFRRTRLKIFNEMIFIFFKKFIIKNNYFCV
jgi:hypothetical protein